MSTYPHMTRSLQWWNEETKSEDRHEDICAMVHLLKEEQQYISRDNLANLKRYIKRQYKTDVDGNIEPAGIDERIGLNVVKSAIDTVSARICMQKPRPQFLTQGGRWKQRLKAKKLQKFCEGLFHEEEFYPKARRVFKDCAIFGLGFLKVYAEKSKIKMERVFPGEIIVDESAAMNCKPRSMFQVKNVPVEIMAAAFPDHKEKILTANIYLHSSSTGRMTNMIEAIEAWHLPDQNGKGGRHTVCVDGVTLHDEEWKHDFFPFVELRWNELPVGYYGNGAAEDLAGLSEEIDYLMSKIQAAMHLNATAWLLKHENDKTPNSHFTNRIGTIIEWSGNQPPQLVVHPAQHQQVFEHLKWLYGTSFQDVGVSQMSATSQKPAGLESGIAIQTMLDVESQRHGLIQMAYEDFVVRCAKVVIALAKETFKGGQSDFKVKFDGGRFVETIEWNEVNMDEDEYILKIWPTNLLPSTPSGRLDTVQKMLETGVIDAQTGMMLLDFPDVEHIQDVELAALKNILWIVDKVIYDGEYIEPRQYQNLQLGIKHMQLGLARAETEGAPESVIQRGLEWIADASDLLAPPPPPATLGLPPDQMAAMSLPPDAMGAMPPGMPPAGGEPISLDPNAPPMPGPIPPMI